MPRAQRRQGVQNGVAVSPGTDQAHVAQHGSVLTGSGWGDVQCPGQFGGRAPGCDGPDRLDPGPPQQRGQAIGRHTIGVKGGQRRPLPDRGEQQWRAR